MLLITNNCMGGYFYRDVVKTEYNHPFFWGTTSISMLNLIRNWDNINFKNYSIEKYGDWKFKILIDNKAEYRCLHYHFDKNTNKPTVRGCDVFYNKIWEYIQEKYETRLERMLKLNENPTFVIHWFPGDGYTEEMLDNFIKEDIKYKTVIFMPYKKYAGYKNGNIKLVYEPKSDTANIFYLATKISENL